jgi:hypothetical protein
VRIAGTTGSLILFGNTMEQDVVLSGNRTAAAPTVAGNRVTTMLRCDGSGARPVNLGIPNTVAGSADDCAT